MASAHKACKSLVRVRCSLKHLLNSWAGNELAQEHITFQDYKLCKEANCIQLLCCTTLFSGIHPLLQIEKKPIAPKKCVADSLQIWSCECYEAQTFCYPVTSCYFLTSKMPKPENSRVEPDLLIWSILYMMYIEIIFVPDYCSLCNICTQYTNFMCSQIYIFIRL